MFLNYVFLLVLVHKKSVELIRFHQPRFWNNPEK